MIKGSLLLSAPIVKHFRSKKSRFGPKFDGFGELIGGLELNLSFMTPKMHILVWFHVFWAIVRKNPSTGLTCTRVWEKKV